MKRNWKGKHISFHKLFSLRKYLIGATLFFTMMACSDRDQGRNEKYTCPMHPKVLANEPGSCPVCGMDLVRKARPGEEIKITEDLSRLMKSPNEVIISSIKTIQGEYKSVPLAVKGTGVVTYDTRNIYAIPARVGGRLEKVYLNYIYQPVRKGQQVAEIYSLELMTAQRELLFLLEHDAENTSLIQSAKSKLELLGLTSSQISGFVKSRHEQNTFALFSPYDGYLITDKPAPAPLPATSGVMPENVPAAATLAETGMLVREGDYVSAGQTLFKVVNTSALRIELDLPGRDASAVRVGDTITITTDHDKKYMTSVDFVQPFYDEGANFTKIRLYMLNNEDLRIGQLVSAKIYLKHKESLWVPRTAVLDLGTKQVVFVKNGEALRPKSIVTGIRSGDLVEVVKGLASSDEIAANAQFLVDSESFIKPVN